MAIVFFGHFGGKDHPSSHFESHEQQILSQAVADASESISQALIAARHNFKGYHDQIKLWFGEVTPEQMEDLKRAVYNMHSTFMDPKTFIKFIDARGQYFHPYMGRMTLSNIADAKYDELMMQGGKRTKISEYTHGLSYPLSWASSDGKYNGHAGSVMNIYIGAKYFCFSTSKKVREQTILHEYSHKALFSVDYAVSIPDPNKDKESTFIYGEKKCQWLATINSLEAMRNADCWAFFLSGFTEVEKSQIKVEAMIEQKVAVKKKRKRVFSSKLRYKSFY